MKERLQRALRFSLLFAPQVLIAPVAFFLGVTFLHELAHAAAALTMGGQVVEFAFLPGPHNLGHMRWDPPANAPGWFGDVVSVAPYVMWSGFALLAAAIAALPNRLHWLAASSLFYWWYVVPLGDIGWNLFSGGGDLAVGGIDGLLLQTFGAIALLGAYAAGYPIQRRLFAERAVDLPGYVVASAVVGGASGLAGVFGLVILSL